MKSFVRSDILGIVLRAGILGALLVWWTRSGMMGSGIYLFFVFLAGVQMSSLLRYHSESFWLHVYPIPPGSRRTNAIGLAFQIQLLFAVLTWLPLLGAGSDRLGPVFLTLVIGVVLCLLFRFFAGRKNTPDDDDE